jgi:pimeloyl-ACP methyl ester carboxylesterase
MSLALPRPGKLLPAFMMAGCALTLAACDRSGPDEITTLPPLAEDAPWWSVIEHETALRMVLSPDGTRMAWSQSIDGSSYLLVAPAGRPDEAVVRQMPAWGLIWTPREGLVTSMQGIVASLNDANIVEAGSAGGDWHELSELIPDARDAFLSDRLLPGTSTVLATHENPPAHWGQFAGRGLPYRLVIYRGVSADSSLLIQQIAIEEKAFNLVPLGEAGIAVATIYQTEPGAPIGQRLVHPFGAPINLGMSGEGSLQPIAMVSPDEPERLYALDSLNADQTELVILSLPTGEREVIVRSASGHSLYNPALDSAQHLLAVHDNPVSPRPVALVPGMQDALDILESSENTAPDDLSLLVAHATENAAQVIFRRIAPDGRLGYVFVDTTTGSVTPFQLSDRASRAIQVTTLQVPSTDGRLIPAFLQQPINAADAAALIVSIHGGPMANDSAAPDTLNRGFLARGLPVLTINYRGSTGHGIEHERAGDMEFDGLMIRDLEAAIAAVFDQGLVAHATPVILFGHSFGGHLEFALARENPGLACAVIAINPASDVVGFQRRGAPFLDAWSNAQWRRIYGAWYEPLDGARQAAASATARPDDWATPVAIIASQNDTITPQDMVAETAAIYQDDLLLPYQVVEGASHNFVPHLHDPAIGAAIDAALTGPCRVDMD